MDRDQVFAFGLLATHPLLSQESSRDLRQLAKDATVLRLRPRGIVARTGSQPNGVIFLCEGIVSLVAPRYQTRPARLRGFVKAPALLGEPECIAGHRWAFTIRAVERSAGVVVPWESFAAYLADHQRVAMSLYSNAHQRHLRAQQIQCRAISMDTTTRLLDLLLDYVRRFGTVDEDVATIHVPLTKVDLAGILGVAPKTVTRAFRELSDAGLVNRRRETGPGLVFCPISAARQHLRDRSSA